MFHIAVSSPRIRAFFREPLVQDPQLDGDDSGSGVLSNGAEALISVGGMICVYGDVPIAASPSISDPTCHVAHTAHKPVGI